VRELWELGAAIDKVDPGRRLALPNQLRNDTNARR